MAFALIESGAVIQIAAAQFKVHPSLTWVDLTSVSPVPAVGWTHDGGGFHAPPVPAIDWAAQARDALATSDVTILRCTESGVAVPAEWKTYRVALRSIVSGAPANALPARPTYPIGT